MKGLIEAQREVLDAVATLPEVTVAVEAAAGLALAESVVAPHDVPPFANSAMDGYAVIAQDVAEVPVELKILEDVPAGSVPTRVVTAGLATRIMTGAPMPEGADTVVPVEDSESSDETVRLLAGRPRGANVRPAGGDLEAGQAVFPAGVRLTPPRIGVLASLGISPTVRRRPLAAVFSTGDEVVPPDAEELAPGLIRDSNRPMLTQLLEDVGCEIRDFGIVGDDEAALRATLAEAAEAADIIVSSGGVSMGEYDLVKHVLRGLGSVDFWRVAMKPGKPFAFGKVNDVPFFGLPGNPVSVFISFEQFVRPAVLTMMGARSVFRSRVPGVAVEAMPHDEQRLTFLRASVTLSDEGRFRALPMRGQGSHMLGALAAADALAVVPAGVQIGPGDPVTLEMMMWPEGRTAEEALG